MGADVKDETNAIEELKGLSKEARRYISHHFRNAIVTLEYATRHDPTLHEKTLLHMLDDLKRIGC